MDGTATQNYRKNDTANNSKIKVNGNTAQWNYESIGRTFCIDWLWSSLNPLFSDNMADSATSRWSLTPRIAIGH